MISKKLAIDVLNEALATGADYAEIFYEDSSSNSISIENGKVETATSNALCGVGLRLLKENQCIYGYTNDLSKKGLFALANSLNKSLNGKRVLTVDNLDMIRCKNRNPVVNSYKNISIQEKIDLVKEILLKVFKYNTWQEFVDSQQLGECQTIAKAVCRLFPKFKYVSVYVNASDEANEALKEESVAIHYLNKLR